MKLLIISSDPTFRTWKKRDQYLKDTQDTLNTGKNASFTISFIETDEAPTVSGGRISHDWLLKLATPYYNLGHDIVGFHMSKRQAAQWGIKSSLRGSNPKGQKDVESYYVWSDENTKRRGLSQFVQTNLHEICHTYFEQCDKEDITHTYHAANSDISGLFKTFDWARYKPILRKQVSQLQRIVATLMAFVATKKPTTLLHPVEQYKKLISQQYGVRNETYYPQTKHHIGTDYACPVGTPVRAPWNGQVIVAGTSPALGNFCHYKYTFDGVTYVARFMHLTDVPAIASYKRGEMIELSGKTGRVSGPHLHVDLFYNEVRVDILTEKNFRNLTINPEEHYV